MIFSAKGFQQGAITMARYGRIELFKVREPTPEEFGLPGRQVDFLLQYISVAIGSVELPGAITLDPDPPHRLALNMKIGAEQTRTPIVILEGAPNTLEEAIVSIARSAAHQFLSLLPSPLADGADCELKFRVPGTLEPPMPIQTIIDGRTVYLPKIILDVGGRVRQEHFRYDRGKDYVFVLAVEDCVRRSVTRASRHREQAETVQRPVVQRDAAAVAAALKNGAVMPVWLEQVEPFDEFVGLTPGQATFGPLRAP